MYLNDETMGKNNINWNDRQYVAILNVIYYREKNPHLDW